MGVRPTFSLPEIRVQLQAVQNKVDTAILRTFRFLGEAAVTIARNNGAYQDVTGNLRSSVGYIVVHDGRLIESSFKPAARRKSKSTSTGAGALTGRELALSLVGDYPRGWALIIVAGMNYAAQVESRGKDVLTSAEQYCQRELPLLLEQLTQSISRLRAQ